MRGCLPIYFLASENLAGIRLDVALSFVFPEVGIRARRRLWDWCTICVNGKPQPAGYTVKENDSISIEENMGSPLLEKPSSSSLLNTSFSEVRESTSNSSISEVRGISFSNVLDRASFLATFENFVLFYKPSGMHTANIVGKKTLSLESLLPELWQNQYSKNGSDTLLPILLTRLDYLTSGIVIAAKNEEAKQHFRDWELHGQVEKTYFAVAEGNISQSFIIKNALDSAKRTKTRVLDKEGDFTRWSHITPLLWFDKKNKVKLPYFLKNICGSPFSYEKAMPSEMETPQIEATLVRVNIFRGIRHQIRVHLSSAEYPLMGDPLYGKKGDPFLLHHALVKTPEFSYSLLPHWINIA